jgi:hypothetical protein
MSTTQPDLSLVLVHFQRATRAAEAALQITERLRDELGPRLTSLEARFGALESRVTSLALGVDSLQRGVLKIADILDDHGARLDTIDGTLRAILAKLP